MDVQNFTFKFMEDGKQWKWLSPDEKQIRLMDIEVIFREAKDLIKREMIAQGFKTGSKVIDISYFTGLNENGYALPTFLIQHESGGEIRALSLRIDLARMTISTHMNHFYSNGKERYWYLKRDKKLDN